MRRKCRNGCLGPVEQRHITQTFDRKGSPVQVVIKNIPVTACSVCGEMTMSIDTLGNVNDILRPFHGSHGHVPELPPAEVFIAYDNATRVRKAA
ncbi:MAG: hypothetical protein AUJ92_04815 [Armatimonadetes bacterium CG2_30_59_28]|nr:YgiT-type zinc finger protein [Armatimonadota bacterium]OIO96921.1 MAG: hypothetical protein AUJ92_04815 [Armatimonadetes bacterium CG2_30_59_28]PIU65417.1 MAG: hypothetical protein COS85_08880 [Armatimonadetes bacterium CG07_land_8_20_14_0_80_59_28]PIX41235.1 MAG: hypothetical protein COZ56_12600 [Armatimonadetes bacterium CG_4_8_14_3_um_filter_58_9]PIY42817.1 MAG: hypothetical protein COZ05_12870 [Armatimonadetes bacterium CG_4_10_14_3_um_filter_59_10]PJB78650.1 MAG: hypothetical protein 